MKTHTNTNPLCLHPPALPRLYGSVKVGERGQVVVPQEARVELGLRAGDKLLALGGFPGVRSIVLVKEESFGEVLAEVTRKLSSLEALLGSRGSAAAAAPAGSRAAARRRPATSRAPGGNGRSRA
jgi:AbrB family looped-hinge helix DNA binding protein